MLYSSDTQGNVVDECHCDRNYGALPPSRLTLQAIGRKCSRTKLKLNNRTKGGDHRDDQPS